MNAVPIRIAPYFHLELPLEKRGALIVEEKASAPWSQVLTLYRIPEHLRRLWWNVAANELLSGEDSRPGFGKFLGSFQEFATFKALPITKEFGFDVLARAPGPEKRPDELKCQGLVSMINLGDNPTHVQAGDQKLSLASGEAIWAPQNVLLGATNTLDKDELDVFLMIYGPKV